ncbi:MAG TPA: hypothetical protein VLL75_23335 [Vicinamibacteria bacterium]|nr:hypothetical protein [Vicinamibacteria bacterium]
MVEATSHTWSCPSCGRRVPLRAGTCHCGMTRTQAEERAAAAAAAPVRPPDRRRAAGAGLRAEVVAAMTRDVKLLVGVSALVLVAGLGWLLFGPRSAPAVPPVLGWVDQGPPPAPKPTPLPRPPFKLPWWK